VHNAGAMKKTVKTVKSAKQNAKNLTVTKEKIRELDQDLLRSVAGGSCDHRSISTNI
jgi:hypothetical protein